MDRRVMDPIGHGAGSLDIACVGKNASFHPGQVITGPQGAWRDASRHRDEPMAASRVPKPRAEQWNYIFQGVIGRRACAA